MIWRWLARVCGRGADVGLKLEAHRFGRKPIPEEWRKPDEAKATAAAHRARQYELQRRREAVARAGMGSSEKPRVLAPPGAFERRS